MKQILLRILMLSFFIAFAGKQAYACHGVALVNYSAVVGPTGVTVNGSSDAATCGCGPYYMEVEVACFSTSNFTGNAPACTAASWGTYPWYHALLNVPNYTAAAGWPDNCLVEPYNSVFVAFSGLCPGTQYVLRSRERVCAGTAGPWSATTTFTTPGTPPVFTLTATANPSTICSGNPVTLNAVLNGNGGCGSGTPVFHWMPGNLTGQTVTVTPSVTTVYTVTVTGGYVACYPVPPATVTVTVLPPPIAGTASVSPPVVCQGGCVTLTLTGSTGSIQWQSSPNGITWTNITNATTTPFVFCPVNAAMYFHAIVSGAPGCGSVTSNTVSVGITPVPTLTITPNTPSICLGQSVTLTVSGSSGYTWAGPNSYSAAGASITISPTVTGTYTVSTSATCPATQTVLVTVNPLPVIAFSPPSAAICSGSAVTIDAGSSTNNYSWVPATGLTYLSASHDSVSAAPLTTTTYNVTATSAAGCTANSNITVTVNSLPVLTLSDTLLTICPNMTDTVTVGGASTYTWNPLTGATLLNGSGSQVEFSSTASGTYTVVGTSAAGCVDSATVNVTTAPPIVVDAGLPDSICPGSSTVLNATGGNYYTWTSNPASTITNGNTASPTVSPTGNTMYTVNVTNLAGCSGTDSVSVFVRSIPAVNAGTDTSLCTGASVNLNGSGGGTLAWTGSNISSGANTGTPTVAPGSTGDYILTATDGFGCTNSDTVNVLVHALPNANAGADQYICGSICANLQATGGSNYQWSPATGLSSTTTAATTACPQASTSYIVQVTDGFGCINTDTVDVNVYPPLAVLLSKGDSICPSGQAVISATGSGGDGGPYTYVWSPSTGLGNAYSASTSASPASTTTYTVTVTDNCGSTAVTDTVTILVYPTPQISTTPSVFSGCAPVCVDFTGTSVPAVASNTYDFGDQSTSTALNPNHCYTTAGNYSVIYTVTDVNGCTNSITYNNLITVHPNPVAGFTPTPQTTSILAPQITITPNCTSCDTTTYTMDDYDSSVVVNNVQPFNFNYTEPGTYTITQYAVNQWGCTDVATEVVVIEPDWSFYAPNAFTPNGDGNNDIFYVFAQGINNATFQMAIFDRWGNMLFTSDDLYKGWNGTVNGGSKLVQIDTYVWTVSFKDNDGNPHKFVGHVSKVD